MKLKTRLRITFISIIILPLILTILAFVGIGGYLTYEAGGELDIFPFGEGLVSDNFNEFIGRYDVDFERILEGIGGDYSKLEDKEYLARIEKDITRGKTGIIVRKDQDIYFATDMKYAGEIIDEMPAYGAQPGEAATIYFGNMQRYVKQLDFSFRDGSEGTLFLIGKLNAMISGHLLLDMFIAIILILAFTSWMLTRWIGKGLVQPVDQLNFAMGQIKEGNFDYALQTDQKGDIEKLYGNYEDMRLRLKESAEEKMENEKHNKELISNISHDLKTPITAIKGYVEGIMDGVADTPEKVDKYIKTIYNKANDMDKLINELTIYSGIDNNRILYNYHKINVADYFGDCVEEVGLDLDSKGIILDYTNLTDSDTTVIADPEQMKKVVNNIISNSVKYMDKPKGKIDIRILDELDSIRVEIEDNGKGIAQKDLQRIFERFYRTDASRNSAQGGSGIGLSIVKKIIEDHGGYIWATSKEGEGTCMHFVLRKYVELPVDRREE